MKMLFQAMMDKRLHTFATALNKIIHSKASIRVSVLFGVTRNSYGHFSITLHNYK